MNSDERRMLLAFVLSLGVFLAYEFYITKTYPEIRNQSRQKTAALQPDTTTQAVGTPDTAHLSSRPVAQPAGARALEEILEETHVLLGSGFELTTTNAGAGIRQIRLQGIPRTPHKDTRDIILVDESQPQAYGALRFPADAGPRMFRRVEASPTRVQYVTTVRDLTDSGTSYDVERTIELTANRYEAQMSTVFRHKTGGVIRLSGDSALSVGLNLTPFPARQFRSSIDLNEIHVKLGGSVERRKENVPGFFSRAFGRSQEIERKQETLDGVVHWAALADRYFTVLMLPDTPLNRVRVDMYGSRISGEIQYGPMTLEAGRERQCAERIFAGPKSPDALRAYGEDVLEVMNFGWFHVLGFGMLWMMKMFYRLIPNYGVAIILMTFIVRMVLYPLTYKSYVSMAKLKELSPKMKELQEKHKNSAEKLNREMWKLYKDNKVNPAGGCLPIVFQIPVFIAFYSMLQYAIELRGAQFLWLKDLSEKDPFYVLPVIMGISMLIQQKMTPSPDPNQARIGMIMTAFFTLMFLTFPSGLVLYWLVSNVLGIAQQKIIEKKMKSTVPPALILVSK